MEFEQSYTVYVITNKETDKKYVGCTTRPIEMRLREHITCARQGGTTKFYKAIREGEEENFSVEPIEKCDSEEEAQKAEIYWIKAHNAIEGGYNTHLTSPSRDYGEGHYRHRTSDEEVYRAIERVRLEGEPTRGVAEDMDVSQRAVSRWVHGDFRNYIYRKFLEDNPNYNPDTYGHSGNNYTSDAEKEEIRKRYATTDESQYDLADEYGVCQKTISNIVNGTYAYQ
ncbi:hypothetical protein OSG_eHP25_00100 [environmental Halophage eHP-25]|nr:hypothetical protein OSG_eHP25_00100 [environmental Halophage eHP-25]